MDEQRRTRRGLPAWAIALVAVVGAVLVVGVVLGVTVLRSSSAEGAARDACGDAVRARLGTGVSDVDTTRYPPLVQRTGGTYEVSGEVDFTRDGQPDRGYYTCEAMRSGGTTTVTSVTGL